MIDGKAKQWLVDLYKDYKAHAEEPTSAAILTLIDFLNDTLWQSDGSGYNLADSISSIEGEMERQHEIAQRQLD